MDELAIALRTWSRRLKLQLSLKWLCFGVAVGVGLALLPAIVARVWPLLTVTQLILIAVLASGGGFLVAIVAPWLTGLRRTPLSYARYFDNIFGLQQRVSTALELSEGALRSANDEMRKRQVADAVRHATQVNVGKRLPLRLSVRDAAVAFGLVLALALAIFIPNDQQSVLARRALAADELKKEAQALEDIKQAIENNPALTADQKTQALEALNQAEQELKDAKSSPEEALAALNNAQDALEKVRDGVSEQKLGDLEHAGQNMTPDDLTNALANSLSNREFDKAANQLRDLTNPQGKALSEEEQQRVANQLDQMSRDVQSSDAKLAQSLKDAAQNLREGKAQDAQQNLQKAADALDKSEQADQASSAVSEAQNNVGEARQRLSQAAGKDQQGQQSSGQSGQQQKGPAGQPGQAGKESDATGDQFGDSTSGSSSQGQPGSSNIDTTRSQHSEDTGSSNEVWAPQRLGGDGQPITLPDAQGKPSANPNGKPNQAPGGQSSVPYQQVYADYRKTADDAIQNGDVPSEYRDYVRDYFSSLNPRQTK